MSKIQINLDRQESYALLVATEFVRQIFNIRCREEGGIPLISSIRLVPADREHTRVHVVFEFNGSDFVAKASVATGDVWPKKGVVSCLRVDVGGIDILYSAELVGNPGQPAVKFDQMRTNPHE